MTLSRVREYLGVPVSNLLVVTLLVVPFIFGAQDALAQSVIIPADDADWYRGVFFAEGMVAEQIPEIRDFLMMETDNEDPQVVQIISDFRARITDEIGTQHPEFFTTFAAAMQSGDPYVIDEAIKDGAEVTVDTIRAMPEIVALRAQMQQDPQLAANMIDDMAGTPELADTAVLLEIINVLGATEDPRLQDHTDNFTSVVVALVAVAAIVAATYVFAAHAVAAVFSVAAAAVIAQWVAAWRPRNKNPRLAYGSLQREQLINSLANLSQ